MKTFKELRTELNEAKGSKARVKTTTGVRPDINLGPDISGSPTPNLPAVRPQGTTNLPAVRPEPPAVSPQTTNLPTVRPQTNVVPKVAPKTSILNKLGRLLGRVGSGAGLALEPSELGTPETETDYEKEMQKYREKYPTASMGPKQRQRYLEKNKPTDGEYIPKPATGTQVVPRQRAGETIDVKPETKPKTTQAVPVPSPEVKTQPKTKTETKPKTTQVVPSPKTETKPKPEVKTQTQAQPKKKIPTPTAPVTTDTGRGKPKPPGGGGKGGGPVGGGPSGGGKGPGGPGKAPFIIPPFRNTDGGAGKELDPNVGRGFVTAGASLGPKGELRPVNVARGKADATALPHKATRFDIPLQKASNVPSIAPKFWKQASSAETTGSKLPPQGSRDRDVELKARGYTKF